jgi:hypothetical protein
MQSPYRQLDAMTEGPDRMGPTRDHHALAAAEPTWIEQKRHDIRPGRMPVTLALQPARPQTLSGPTTLLKPGRLPVLIRASNVNPQASGRGNGHTSWSVSDPYWGTPQGRRMSQIAIGQAGANQGVAGLGALPFGLTGAQVGIAAAVGLLGWMAYKAVTK